MIITTLSKKKKYLIDNLYLGLKKKFFIKVTRKLHNDFSKLSGDNSPIHQNKSFCKKHNFQKLVGYGFLITTILSKIYGVYFPGGSELCLQQTCNFKKPFYINDNLIFLLKITHINQQNKIITIETKVMRNKKELIFEGYSLLQLSLNK